jgi:RNA polymerase sigma-70 factor (ECF subfamily)
VVTESDETIMNKVKEGHLDDLSELFERYHVRIYNFILKLTYDRLVSQDLTQNLFYRIIKYRHTFNDAHTFKSWIYQLARNIHSDYCKSLKKMTDQYISVDSYDENTVDTDNEFGEEEFQRLEKALSRLKPEQKEILILSRFQGLKYSEISAIQNSSVPAIKVQVHRAIKELRNFYFKTI